MKSKILLFGIIFLALSKLTFAQKENNVWTFGGGIGINFNTTPPSIIKSAIVTAEACASICDTSGNILFYTNGISVWDKTNSLMPNGTGLLGTIYYSSTQGATIVPIANYPNLYYLIVADEFSDPRPGYIRYSLIDMTLNGGKGDIVSGKKNIILDSNMSEKVIVAPTCNGVWLLTHHIDSPIFYARKINSPSSIGAPIISTTSGLSDLNRYEVGEMKFSSNYKQIALGNYTFPFHITNSKIELFDFDTKTGIVSGYSAIDNLNTAYSVEFSPDNSKLYVLDYSNKIYQYDLSLMPSVIDVSSSQYELERGYYIGMRRGPDGKIYLRPGYTETNISCINNPNDSGAKCNIQDSLPHLVNTNTEYFLQFGNSTARPILTESIKKVNVFDSTICKGKYITCTADTGYDNIIWNDGDTSTKRILNTTGKYWRTSNKNCQAVIDTFKLTVNDIDTNFHSFDTTVCFQNQLIVKQSNNYSNYTWSDGSHLASNSFNTDGIKWVLSTNNDCKMTIDTFKVKFINFNLDLRDTAICEEETILFDATTANATRYLWNNNSTNPTYLAAPNGKYWVTVNIGICAKTDTINVSKKSFELDLGRDRDICKEESLILESNLNNVSYLWQDGSTAATFQVKVSGTYSLVVRQGTCVSSDSIKINVVQCNNCIAIPSAFTPNGDGKNDHFKPIFNCPTQRYEMLIVNRYGQVIFSTDNPNNYWDGNFNNQEQELGVFYYLIKVQFAIPNAKEEIYKGDISLIR